MPSLPHRESCPWARNHFRDSYQGLCSFPPWLISSETLPQDLAMGSRAIRSGRCHADRTHHSVCESPPKGSFSCQTFMLPLYNCCKVHAHARPKLLEEHLGKTPDLPKPMCPSGLPMIGEFIRDCVGGNRKLAQSYQLISPIAFQQQKWKRNRHSHG